jgi:hypothetical protein
MNSLERMAKDQHKQAGFYKILYERALGQLNQNEAELMKVANEIEKVNFLEDHDLLDGNDEAVKQHKDSLQAMISMLNQENLNLKIKLERIQTAHDNEMECLNTENECLRSVLANELTAKARMDQEKSKEIEILKKRLSSEEDRQNDLRENCMKEITAAQIRFENELTRQNCLMQGKNEELAGEVKRLNAVVHTLQDEKTEMLRKLCERERQAERECIIKNESNSFLSRKLDKNYLTKLG